MSRRKSGSKAIRQLVAQTVKQSQRERGLGDGALIAKWPEIVGKEFASYCVPHKISGSKGKRKLSIWCDPACAMALHYQSGIIIEKISCYLGYRAVDKISIKQHYFTEGVQESLPLPALSKEAQEMVSQATTIVKDKELQARLTAIGIATRQKRQSLSQ